MGSRSSYLGQEPERLNVWLKQRTRWARGNIWVINHYITALFKMKNNRITADIIYFFFTYLIFFVSVVVSDVIFILGLTGIVLNLEWPLYHHLDYGLCVVYTGNLYLSES